MPRPADAVNTLPPDPADRAALEKMGFPIGEKVWIGWTWLWKPGDDLDGKPKKFPLPAGSQIDRGLWKSLAEIPEDQGVGLVIAAVPWLTLIDLDECFEAYSGSAWRDTPARPQRLKGWAREFVQASSCVTRSASGRGLHCWFVGALPSPATWWEKDGVRIEAYGAHSTGRFIAMTGRPAHSSKGELA